MNQNETPTGVLPSASTSRIRQRLHANNRKTLAVRGGTAQAVAVGAVGRADDQRQFSEPGQLLDRACRSNITDGTTIGAGQWAGSWMTQYGGGGVALWVSAFWRRGGGWPPPLPQASDRRTVGGDRAPTPRLPASRRRFPGRPTGSTPEPG